MVWAHSVAHGGVTVPEDAGAVVVADVTVPLIAADLGQLFGNKYKSKGEVRTWTTA